MPLHFYYHVMKIRVTIVLSVINGRYSNTNVDNNRNNNSINELFIDNNSLIIELSFNYWYKIMVNRVF